MGNCLICGAETETGCIDLRQREPRPDERPGQSYWEPFGKARYYCRTHREHMRNACRLLDGWCEHDICLAQKWQLKLWVLDDPAAFPNISATLYHDCGILPNDAIREGDSLKWRCPDCGSIFEIR